MNASTTTAAIEAPASAADSQRELPVEPKGLRLLWLSVLGFFGIGQPAMWRLWLLRRALSWQQRASKLREGTLGFAAELSVEQFRKLDQLRERAEGRANLCWRLARFGATVATHQQLAGYFAALMVWGD
jgi:hypothetical protein